MKKGRLDDFYISLTSYMDVKNYGLTDKHFTKNLVAEGWDKKYLAVANNASGLTVLWPSEALSVKIAKNRGKSETRDAAEELVKSLFIDKLIRNAKDFEGAVTKNGIKITGTKVIDDDTIKFASGVTAKLDTVVKATDRFKVGDLDQENKRKFAIWHLVGNNEPFQSSISGAFDVDDSTETSDSLETTLKSVFSDNLNKIEHGSAKLVSKLYTGLGENYKELLDCIIQGNPVAEFFVIANSTIFNTSDVRSILNNSANDTKSYKEIFDESKTKTCVATGLEFKKPNDTHAFFRSVAKTGMYDGVKFICPELSKHFFAMCEFYSKVTKLVDKCNKASKNNKDSCLREILMLNTLFNTRSAEVNSLPEGLFDDGSESISIALEIADHFYDNYIASITSKHKTELPREIYGGNDKYDNILTHISNLSEVQIKEMFSDPRAKNVIQTILKNNL